MKRTLVCVVASLAGCKTVSTSTIPGEVAYRKGDTSVVVVYNIETMQFADVPVEYLQQRDAKYGEFGGHLRLCSNAEYYCLIGGIAIAIPKNFAGQQEWEFAGQECRSQQPLQAGHSAQISCSSQGWSNTAMYLPSRGIISYSTQAEPNVEYRLVDPFGLFASGS